LLAIRDVTARFAAPYKLHFACGSVKLNGWINIERDPVSAIVDVSWDVRMPLPLPDGCAELVFHEHFLSTWKSPRV
jgi:predicted SAM-dependent methyltransferase